MSAATALIMRSALGAAIARYGAKLAVCDFSHLNSEDWRIAVQDSQNAPHTTPVAYLVAPSIAEEANQHAAAMARHGLIRRIVTGKTELQAWLALWPAEWTEVPDVPQSEQEETDFGQLV